MKDDAGKPSPSKVVSDILAGTDFAVPPEKIEVTYDPESGVTSVYVESLALVNNRNARLALRTAIGHALASAVSETDAASQAEDIGSALTLGTPLEMGPPQRHRSEPKMLYGFRDPAKKVDLTPRFGMIDIDAGQETFRKYYERGPASESMNHFGGGVTNRNNAERS